MAKKQSIDIGLAISGALLKPGQTRTLAEIAAYCDCHKNMIWHIEDSALKKIRNLLMRKSQAETREAMLAQLSS